ncbi:hypothetical protein M9H77_09086 [Catharanthus roseus]|uniref:Uncharacterized protein n=1 Tax=Catharanthus roseus TaxID=4058 RepID=A0ACC0BZN0_CATRO|nr:hypothetical protein M9H77_09086 [Catharanthus roseus]
MQENDEANKLAFNFFFPSNDEKENEAPPDCLHILDMYRKTILEYPPGAGGTGGEEDQSNNNNRKKMIPKEGDDIIRSAVELYEAGIKIRRSKTKSLRDIKFKKNGELWLPMIIVDDSTEPLFLNLIAFERFHVGAGNEVTAFVFFMDNIIDDARDIALLHSKDIVQNGIGSDKAAAKLFNSLSKDVTLNQNSHLGEVYTSVNAYCKKKWPKYRANLKHTYFTSPWALLSVVAAIFLFALTITQTAYTIYPFYKGK